jgi:transcriptional regulator with XRE-family HTH domain
MGGDFLDVITRIDDLMKERGWTDYKLSIESGLSSSTIANIHRRNTIPSIPTIEAICNAFGISLSQFFCDDSSFVQLDDEQQEFFNKWITLTDTQKKLIYSLIKEFR